MSTSSVLFDWRTLRQSFMQRKYIFLSVLFLCVTIGLLFALLSPPEYESFATIMMCDTDLLSGSQLRFIPNYPQREELEMFRRRISSYDFLNKMLDSLSFQKNVKLTALVQQTILEHPNVDRTEIVRQVYLEHLKKQIAVRLVAYNMIEIKATAPTSGEAFHLARALTNLAINESRDNQVKTVSAASSFSKQQMEIYKKKLAETEEKLFQFNRGIMDAKLINTELSVEKLQELEAILLSNNIDMQTKQTQYQEKSPSLKILTAEQKRALHQSQMDLKNKLLERITDLNQLLIKFSWRDIEIIQLNEQIALLKKEYKERLGVLLTPIFTEAKSNQLEEAIRAEYLALEISLILQSHTILSDIIQGHKKQLRETPSQEDLKQRLERDVRVNREIYEMLLQQARGTEIRESAQLSEVKLQYKVITPPVLPLDRVRPIRRRIMMIALFIGFSLAAAAIVGLEALDASIRRVEDVPKFLGVPVLATIPRIKPSNKKHGAWHPRLGTG
jgi:uncharacterized protein involved in exopolysaccharide biosynthesis